MSRSDRSITISKVRPADWGDGPDLGRHETLFGICDLVERGRELKTEWIYHGPKPRQVISKRKYRGW